MEELVTWLRAALDEREREIEDDCLPSGEAAYVQADVDSKRRIIDLADDATGLDMSVDSDRRVGMRDEATEPYLGDQLLRQLALPYAGRDGYRAEWKP